MADRPLVVVVTLAATILCSTAGGQISPTVTAVSTYARGQHQAALAQIPPSMTVGGFLPDLSGWISAAAAADRPRRTLVATTFAMDAVWSLSKQHDRQASLGSSIWIDTSGARNADRRDWSKTLLTDSFAQFPVAAWACNQIKNQQMAPDVERAWWRLSLGLMENIRVWRALTGPAPGDQAIESDSPAARELRDGHLRHVPERLESAPEFLLDATLIGIAHDVALLEPSRAGRSDVLRDQPLTVRAKNALPAARTRLMALAVHLSIRGEVLLRAGYFDLRLGRFDQALLTIDQARPMLQEAFLQAVADYLTGWIHQHQSRHELSVEYLARVRQYAPHSRNVSVLLAQELFLLSRTSDAYEVLDSTFRTPSESLDLLTTFERAGARHIPEHLEVLRRGIH